MKTELEEKEYEVKKSQKDPISNSRFCLPSYSVIVTFSVIISDYPALEVQEA